MTRRFEYRRITGRELSEALDDLDLPAKAFCRIFGVNPQVMTRWLRGDQETPPWVFPVIWLLREIPEAVAIARSAAASHIVRDNEHPSRGEYPYLSPDDGEDSP